MQNKIDMIIDVSKQLTHQWVCANIMGLNHSVAGNYAEYPDLYRKDMPATFDLVMQKVVTLSNTQASYLLESISCDLFQFCVEEGWLDDPFKIDRPTDSIKLDTPAQIGFHRLDSSPIDGDTPISDIDQLKVKEVK